jgi:monoamine oxidase
MRVMVIGAGLAGLAATEHLLDSGADVVVVDAFPRVGGRVANFDVQTEVAGLIPGDVVEHGLHAWFQHYEALFGLMARAGVPKPPFAGRGVHLFSPDAGHVEIAGGPFVWLMNALGLPRELRGSRRRALLAFGRLIASLERALEGASETDRETAAG